MLAAALSDLGRRVRYGRVNQCTGAAARQADAVLCSVSYLDRHGRAVGLGAAARLDEPDAVKAASHAIEVCTRALRTRRVLVAGEPMCGGARQGLAALRDALERTPGPLYVVGRLHTDEGTLADLRRRGVRCTDDVDRVPDGATVAFPPHGVTLTVRAQAAARGLRVVDTTCPLVAGAHAEVRRLADDGDTVVLVGSPGYASHAGYAGQAPEGVVTVRTPADVDAVEADPERVSYVVQNGMVTEDAARLVARLRSRYPRIRGGHPDTWCYAASDRVEGLRTVASASDVVLICGPADAADCRALARRARARCAQVHIVDDVAQLRPQWFTDAATVGLAAGVPGRPGLTDEVIEVLSGLGPLSVVRREATSGVVPAAPGSRIPSSARREPPATAAPRSLS